MSKLPSAYQFTDLSDYGRPIARYLAVRWTNTAITPIYVTTLFILAGAIAIWSILNHWHWMAALFLIVKSILDAADGELARLQQRPSYTGRYYDSIADILLNFLFLSSFAFVSEQSIWYALVAFIGLQLQGTLYNYYYVILRNTVAGDATSRVFETSIPVAMQGEDQRMVTLLYRTYRVCYGVFDYLIYQCDKKAIDSPPLPKWFMTLVSTFGLGFQLALMAILLLLGLEAVVLPFFIGYSFGILLFIAIRRLLLK
ncbi:MAG: CDP-alcohol phosphatidyltransferase family protein [Dokdonia sp.]|jgi:phosphatidylglycerophosphate synthase